MAVQETINKLEKFVLLFKTAFKNLFLYVKPVLPSNWMSRMTHSSDREHKTPLSPVRRHESITETIHTLTTEPANLTALLSRRGEIQIFFHWNGVALRLIFARPAETQEQLLPYHRRYTCYGPVLTVFRVEMQARRWKVPTENVSIYLTAIFHVGVLSLNSLELKTPSLYMMMENLNSWRPKTPWHWTFLPLVSFPLPFCPTFPWLVHMTHIRVRLETCAAFIGGTILTRTPCPCMAQSSRSACAIFIVSQASPPRMWLLRRAETPSFCVFGNLSVKKR